MLNFVKLFRKYLKTVGVLTDTLSVVFEDAYFLTNAD